MTSRMGFSGTSSGTGGGGGGSDVGLAEVVGFVTEFNHNVLIFEASAMLIMALFEASILADFRFEALEDLIQKMSKDTLTAANRADQKVFAEALARAFEADKQVLARAVDSAVSAARKAVAEALPKPNIGPKEGQDRPVVVRSSTSERAFSASMQDELKNRDLGRR